VDKATNDMGDDPHKFLEEAISHNVRWMVDESPDLQVMEVGASDYRLETTFRNSSMSFWLLTSPVKSLQLHVLGEC